MTTPQPTPMAAPVPSEATTTESPDDKKMDETSSFSHLVKARLGKRERSILLSVNGEEWTPFPEWSEPKNKPTVSRAIHKLIRLQLIESDFDYAESMRSAKRCDKDGVEQNYYIYYDRTRKLRLTRLGAIVVNQYRDALASGKRIRWSRCTWEGPNATVRSSRWTHEATLEIPIPAGINHKDLSAVVEFAESELSKWWAPERPKPDLWAAKTSHPHSRRRKSLREIRAEIRAASATSPPGQEPQAQQ